LNSLKDASRLAWASSLGINLVLCTVIGLALGMVLDRWLNAKPYFTLGFLLLGIAAGFWNILKEGLRSGVSPGKKT